jgi:ATP-binding protein involved in chromosome partitioning
MEFSTMTAPAAEQVADALRSVRDPEKNADIVALGMVDGIAVRDGVVSFAIEVDPKRGPALEHLRLAAERAVAALPGVREVRAVLTAQRPAPAAAPPAAARPAPQRTGAPGVRRIVAVGSGKGGVGKSTVAVNLALGLAAEGLRTGILDADVYGPSVPRMLGLSGKPEPVGRTGMAPLRAHGLQAMSVGFLVEEGQAAIWRGPIVQNALLKMLRETAWDGLDVLVVDLPPGTGDVQITLAQQVALDGAVVVSTPQDIALIDARRAVAMFRRVEIPILGVVENMSHFRCPCCGERTDLFGHGGARAEAEAQGVPFLGEIPLALAIRETSDAGAPVVASAPDGPEAQAFRAVARGVALALRDGADARRPPPRIVYD